MVMGILLDPSDSVVTVIGDVRKGDEVRFTKNSVEESVIANSNIPQFHKIAITDVGLNDEVLKYGNFIGYAQKYIKTGDYVHTHNLYSTKAEVK